MKTYKKIFLTITVCSAIYFAMYAFKIPPMNNIHRPPLKSGLSVATVNKKSAMTYFTHNNINIILEIANTEATREYGLMNRKSMPENHGMVFIFPHPEMLRFWMKNTLIPLDMIFLNNHQVVAIIPNVPPCKKETNPCPAYGPSIAADQVIELNAGIAKKMAIMRGDTIILN